MDRSPRRFKNLDLDIHSLNEIWTLLSPEDKINYYIHQMNWRLFEYEKVVIKKQIIQLAINEKMYEFVAFLFNQNIELFKNVIDNLELSQINSWVNFSTKFINKTLYNFLYCRFHEDFKIELWKRIYNELKYNCILLFVEDYIRRNKLSLYVNIYDLDVLYDAIQENTGRFQELLNINGLLYDGQFMFVASFK